MIAAGDLKDHGIHTIIIRSIFPTGDTRCFAAPGEDGWTLIDVGVSSPEAWARWEAGIREIGIEASQIRRIYLTHNHPDHAGAAGWLQQQSGAQVFMPGPDLPPLYKYKLPEDEHIRRVQNDMGPYGIESKTIADLVKDVIAINAYHRPFAFLTPLDAGDSFVFGDDEYIVYPAPGHSDGHVVFLGNRNKLLFSGDSFLADRVSQISDWPYSSLEDPLTLNLQALRLIVEQGPMEIQPAHGDPFTHAAQRLEEIEQQHMRRMNKVYDILDQPMTLPEICRIINVKARVLQEFRVSWADTRAYLEALWHQGRIEKYTDNPIRYGPKKG